MCVCWGLGAVSVELMCHLALAGRWESDRMRHLNADDDDVAGAESQSQSQSLSELELEL